MNYSSLLLPALAAAVLAAAGTQMYNTPQTAAEKTFRPADPVATHNMLAVGQKVMYLSHLPMFQGKGMMIMPHRYQAILEVDLEQKGVSVLNRYTEDKLKNPNATVYTLGPEDFVLPTLVSANPKLLRTSLKGMVYRGHLEKLGSHDGPIYQDSVVVKIKRVVHFRQFDDNAKRPEMLQYLLFGKGPELFLAHFIIAPPDFDQILSVQATDVKLTDDELSKGILIEFPQTSNSAATRLKASQQIAGQFQGASPAAVRKARFSIGREIYFEQGELLMPPSFRQTLEEKKAGFR